MGQNGTKFRENYKNNEKRGWELCNNYLIVRNLDESEKDKKQLSHQNTKMKSSKYKLKSPTSFIEKTKKKYLKRKPKSKLVLFEVNREDISKYFYISKNEANSSTATSHKNQKRKSSVKPKLKQENNFCCDIKSSKSANGSSYTSKQLPSELSSKISTIRKYLMEHSSCSEYTMSVTSAHETTTTNAPFHAIDQTSLSWPSLRKYCDIALANLFDQSKSKLDEQLGEPKLNLRHNNTVQIIMNVKSFSSSHTLLKIQSKDDKTSSQHLKLLQQLSKESENTLNRLLELGKKYNLKSECPRLNLHRSCQTLEVAICLDPPEKLQKPLQLDVIPRVVDIKPKKKKKHQSVVNTLSVASCSSPFEESSLTTNFSKILCDTEVQSRKEESSTNACSSKTTITDEHVWSSLKMETLSAKPKQEKRIRKTKIANSDKSLNVPIKKRMHHDSPLQFESEIVFSKVTERKKVKRMSLPRKQSQNVVEVVTKKDYFALEATSSCCDKTSEDISEPKKSKHVNFKKKSANILEVSKKENNNSTTSLIVNKFEEILNKMLVLIANKRKTEVVEKSTSAIEVLSSKQVVKSRPNITSRPLKTSIDNLRILPRKCSIVNPWDSIATNYSNASLDANESSTYSISGWLDESRHGIEVPYKGWDSSSQDQHLACLSEISKNSRKSESSRSMLLPNPILAKECLSEFIRTFDDNENFNVKKKNSNQCFSCSFQTVAFIAILYLTLLQFILTFTVNYFSSFGK